MFQFLGPRLREGVATSSITEDDVPIFQSEDAKLTESVYAFLSDYRPDCAREIVAGFRRALADRSGSFYRPIDIGDYPQPVVPMEDGLIAD